MKRVVRLLPPVLVLPLLLLLSACVSPVAIKPDDPHYAPVFSPSPARQRFQEGSLFSENHLALFGNTNNHQVGDIITINLDERTVSSKSSAVAIDKESTVSLWEGGSGTVLGGNTTKTLPLIGDVTFPTNASQSREFAGDASAGQSNRLQGNISVTITDVFPNGNLVVRGEKWLTLNRGDEFIRISGILRPEDISLQNTVSSTKLANARIAYSGTGELADSQKPGWLHRFFNGPWWPF
ncbi:MAG: flagellar basal body L-ring protein FlgH [Cellvibrionaceae bacterium]|nr:flagellar basal body L-ring protein FlgH [Cellvibrionaceae bacterium]